MPTISACAVNSNTAVVLDAITPVNSPCANCSPRAKTEPPLFDSPTNSAPATKGASAPDNDTTLATASAVAIILDATAEIPWAEPTNVVDACAEAPIVDPPTTVPVIMADAANSAVAVELP